MDDQARWAAHDAAWRDPAEVVAGWAGLPADPRLFHSEWEGPWWDLLAQLEITLLIGREYEHLLLGLSVVDGRPHVTYLPLPHPSGIAYDTKTNRLHVAATRNPNQLITFRPSGSFRARSDWGGEGAQAGGRPLLPVRSLYLPGSLYLHDLALIEGHLHGNAVGDNAVVRFAQDGAFERVWWPASIDTPAGPLFGRNVLQLNSIAAGATLAESFFSASTAVPGPRVPGDPAMKVDGQGVVFAGHSRQPVVTGLTRPHSARLDGGRLWLANSGYGEIGWAADGKLAVLATLPGWTRGVTIEGDVVIVGTSRILPRFEGYAPGLDPAASRCGVHMVDRTNGRRLASLTWPAGNQIFAVTAVPRQWTTGWPFQPEVTDTRAAARLFYAFAGLGEEE